MKISLAITDILILSLAFQGLILSAMLFYTSKTIRSNRWIAAFIFVIAETTLVMEAHFSGMVNKYPQISPLILNLRMALGPLIYFYARSLIYGDAKFKGRQYLHFAPLIIDAQAQVIYLLFITGILSIPFVTDLYGQPVVQSFLFNKTIISDLPTFFSMVIYSALSYRMVRRSMKAPELSAYKLADLKWLRNLLYMVFALAAVFLVNILLAVVSSWSNYLLYIPATLFIYWLGMATYIRQSKMKTADVMEYTKLPAKIYFTEEHADLHHQQLISLMETEQIYLNPLLKLDVVADKLSLSEKVVSSLLNQYVGKNFNDFVNEYRVLEAKKKLAEPAFSQFTIAAIAYECGFNSLATFQRCFKQFTGITPSQYQNSLKSGKIEANNAQIPI
ncbi:helix-turn-helix domain-containing protein [Mucilaginibacter sp. OK098]|uniref:helix-turn-helix domain-containing protein n=1 Tax=Mucilaginibacter sp. OK098 TaxID=1855297 RepID=UPI000912F261|nr:helix-turn-helix domain-containing protein [Mucilaginibacter sp. OK098]SHM02082.1 Helix-turn-helix domain-containing protein [Mucilaginibacter sp. OK098]